MVPENNWTPLELAEFLWLRSISQPHKPIDSEFEETQSDPEQSDLEVADNLEEESEGQIENEDQEEDRVQVSEDLNSESVFDEVSESETAAPDKIVEEEFKDQLPGNEEEGGLPFSAEKGMTKKIKQLDSPLKYSRAFHRMIPKRFLSGTKEINIQETVSRAAASFGKSVLPVWYEKKERQGQLIIFDGIPDEVSLEPYGTVISKLVQIAENVGAFRHVERIKITGHEVDKSKIQIGQDTWVLLIHDGVNENSENGVIGSLLQQVKEANAHVNMVWIHPWPQEFWENTALGFLSRRNIQSQKPEEIAIPVLPLFEWSKNNSSPGSSSNLIGLSELEGWTLGKRKDGIPVYGLPTRRLNRVSVQDELFTEDESDIDEEYWEVRLESFARTNSLNSLRMLGVAAVATYVPQFSIPFLEILYASSTLVDSSSSSESRYAIASAISSGFFKLSQHSPNNQQLLEFSPSGRSVLMKTINTKTFQIAIEDFKNSAFRGELDSVEIKNLIEWRLLSKLTDIEFKNNVDAELPNVNEEHFLLNAEKLGFGKDEAQKWLEDSKASIPGELEDHSDKEEYEDIEEGTVEGASAVEMFILRSLEREAQSLIRLEFRANMVTTNYSWVGEDFPYFNSAIQQQLGPEMYRNYEVAKITLEAQYLRVVSYIAKKKLSDPITAKSDKDLRFWREVKQITSSIGSVFDPEDYLETAIKILTSSEIMEQEVEAEILEGIAALKTHKNEVSYFILLHKIVEKCVKLIVKAAGISKLNSAQLVKKIFSNNKKWSRFFSGAEVVKKTTSEWDIIGDQNLSIGLLSIGLMRERLVSSDFFSTIPGGSKTLFSDGGQDLFSYFGWSEIKFTYNPTHDLRLLYDPRDPLRPINESSKVFDAVASLGLPGVVLWVLFATRGHNSGPQIGSLAALGAPFGILGGVGVLALMAKYGKEIASIGLDGVDVLLRRMKLQQYEVIEQIESSVLPPAIKSEVLRSIRIDVCSLPNKLAMKAKINNSSLFSGENIGVSLDHYSAVLYAISNKENDFKKWSGLNLMSWLSPDSIIEEALILQLETKQNGEFDCIKSQIHKIDQSGIFDLHNNSGIDDEAIWTKNALMRMAKSVADKEGQYLEFFEKYLDTGDYFFDKLWDFDWLNNSDEMSWLETLAETGLVHAQFWLGVLYLNNHKKSENSTSAKKGIYWLREVAGTEGGLSQLAAFELGQFLLEVGLGGHELGLREEEKGRALELKEGRRWIDAAIDHGVQSPVMAISIARLCLRDSFRTPSIKTHEVYADRKNRRGKAIDVLTRVIHPKDYHSEAEVGIGSYASKLLGIISSIDLNSSIDPGQADESEVAFWLLAHELIAKNQDFFLEEARREKALKFGELLEAAPIFQCAFYAYEVSLSSGWTPFKASSVYWNQLHDCFVKSALRADRFDIFEGVITVTDGASIDNNHSEGYRIQVQEFPFKNTPHDDPSMHKYKEELSEKINDLIALFHKLFEGIPDSILWHPEFTYGNQFEFGPRKPFSFYQENLLYLPESVATLIGNLPLSSVYPSENKSIKNGQNGDEIVDSDSEDRISGVSATPSKRKSSKRSVVRKHLGNSKVFDAVAALGVPGIVLWAVIATSGLAGAAGITAALAALGGPLGMLGGAAALALLGRYGKEISLIGLEGLEVLVRNMSISTSEIREKIESSRLPEKYKKHIIDALNSVEAEEGSDDKED